MLKAVFWDVDGTIAETEIMGHRKAFNNSFKYYGLKWFWDEDTYIKLLSISGGLKRIKYYNNYCNEHLDNDLMMKIQNRKQKYYKSYILNNEIKARPGVLRLVNELHGLGIIQAIVTTSSINSLKTLLYSIFKEKISYFSHLITYEDVKNHKPHPDAYLLALERANATSSTTIVIEDSYIGLCSAKAANLNTLITLPPWTKKCTKEMNIANAVVNTLGDEINKPDVIIGPLSEENFINYNYLSKLI